MQTKKLPAFTPERALYDYLIESVYPGYKVTQGYLRLIAGPLGTTQTITWQVIGDPTDEDLGECLLPRSDAFYANIFSIGIGKVASGGSLGSMQEEFFANPYVFTNAAELAAIQSFFNSRMKIQIGDKLYFQRLDIKRFKNVATAQRGLELSGGATGLFAESAFNPMTGFYECVPNIELNGGSTPTIELTLPASVALGGTGGSANYAVFTFRGFYIPDVLVDNKKK